MLFLLLAVTVTVLLFGLVDVIGSKEVGGKVPLVVVEVESFVFSVGIENMLNLFLVVASVTWIWRSPGDTPGNRRGFRVS